MKFETGDKIKLNYNGKEVLAMISGKEMEDDNEQIAIYDLLLNDDFKKIRLTYRELIEKVIE